MKELDGPLVPVSMDHRPRGPWSKQPAAQQPAAAEGGEQAAAAAAEEGAEAEPMQADEQPSATEDEAEQPEAETEAGEEATEGGASEAAGTEADAAEAAGAEGTEGAPSEAATAEGEGEGGKAGFWKRKREQERAAREAVVLPEWGSRGGGARREVRCCRAYPAATVVGTGAALHMARHWPRHALSRVTETPIHHPTLLAASPPTTLQGGGRHRGIDPIVPYVVPEQLSAIREFYGLAPDCPVPDALVRFCVERWVWGGWGGWAAF